MFLHDVGTQQDENDAGSQARVETGHRAGGVEAFPEDREDEHGQICAGSYREGEADKKGHIHSRAEDNGYQDAQGADDKSRDPGHANLSSGLVLLAVVNDIGEKIMRETCAGADGEASNDGEDSCKSHGADEGEENFATEFSGELRGCHVCSAMGCDIVRPHEAGSAEAEECGHDVEKTNDDHRPYHTRARRLGIGHGVEANEDVGQACRAEQQGHAEGDLIPRIFKNQAGRKKVADDFFSIRPGGGDGRERGKEFADVELILTKHEHGQKSTASHEEHRFDDLHPCRGQHSAENHIDDHQQSHPDHSDFVGHPGDQLPHEHAGADHLGDHVKNRNRQRAKRGRSSDRSRAEAVGQHIGHRVFSGIAEGFGHDEEDCEVGHKKADGVKETVVAIHGDHPGDPEKAGCAHVVACHGKAVLPACDAATGGKVGTRTARATGAEVGDDQRGRHKGEEHPKRGVVGRCGSGKKKRVHISAPR